MILLHNFGGGSGLKDTGSLNVELATTSYIHGQPFSTQGATVTYTPPIGDPVDVTAAVTFEPANGEALQQDGQVMVRAIYTSGDDTIYGSAYVNVTPVPQSLSVQLHDTGMKAGDAVSYAGAQVTCLYTDLSTRDISNENITWSPPAGTIQNSDGVLTVTASYTENGTTATGTAEVVVTNKVLTALSFTLPQTTYDYGDKIKYTDAVVTATYNDGSTRIVTNLVEYDPAKNEVLTESTVAQVSYTENSVTKVAGVPITVTPGVDSMKIEWPDAGFSIGSTLDYSGATVTATLTDGTKKDVTEEVTWLPAPGTALTRSQDLTCTAIYASNGKEHEASIEIFVSESKVKSLGASLKKTRFLSGDEFTTSGATVTALYENGTTRDVSDRVTWTPASGDILDSTITKAIAKYEENNVVVTASVDIYVAAINTLSVSTNKTQWIVGDSLNAADFIVTLEYADGTTKDVSSAVTFTPADGATLSEGTLPVKITYTEGSRVYEKVVPITVVNVPVSIEAQHAITTYTVGSSLDYSNDVYIVTMADGTELELSYQQVTNKPSQNSVLDTIGTQLIATSYTKNGVTVTVRSSVSVEADPNSEMSASGQIQAQQEEESADVARSAGYSVKDSDDGESGGGSGGSGGGGTSGGGSGGNSYMSGYTAPAATAYSAPSGSIGGGSGFVSAPTGNGKETALFVPDTDSKVNADGTVTVSSTDRHASVLGTITDNDGNKYSIDSNGNVTCTDKQGNVTTRTLDEYGKFIGLSGNDLQIITDGNDNVTGAKESVSTTYTPDENGQFTDKYGNDMQVNEDGTVSATSTSTSRNEGSYFTAPDGNTYLVSDDGTSIAKITSTGVEEVPLDENNSFEVNGTTYTLNPDGTVTSTTGEGGESSTVNTTAGSIYTAPDGTQYMINSDGTVTSVDGVIMDSAYVGTLIDENGVTYVLDGNAQSVLYQLENGGSTSVTYDISWPEATGDVKTVTIVTPDEVARGVDPSAGGAHFVYGERTFYQIKGDDNHTYGHPSRGPYELEWIDSEGNKRQISVVGSDDPYGYILENGEIVPESVKSKIPGVAPAVNSSMEPEVVTRPTLAEALSGYHGLSPQEVAASNWADGSTSWGGLNYIPTTTTNSSTGGGGHSF